jgi:four helix bundle protein
VGADRHVPIEEMDFFRKFVSVADWAWRVVQRWPPLAVNTVGTQLIRAADRIGATLVEGDGRYSDAEAAHFFTIARASARETRYWITRASDRDLVPEAEAREQIGKLINATRQLNGLIRYRRAQPSRSDRVRDEAASYLAACGDPFVDEE